MKRFLALMLIFLSAGVKAAAQPATTITNMSATPLTQRFLVRPFQTLAISGPISVQISASAAKPALQAIGDAESLAKFYVAEKDGVLYLGVKPEKGPKKRSVAPNILAKVSATQLKQLNYQGSGNVVGENLSGALTLSSGGAGNIVLSGKNINLRQLNAAGASNISISGIKSNFLNITNKSSGRINLNGNMVVNTINQQGKGSLHIEWVNSTRVTVNGSGPGSVFLAGIARELNATLSDHFKLDAKYLHAEKGFINTRTDAQAHVWTKNNLSALATAGSNIYYYHDSQMVAGYMRAPGSVLRMSGLESMNR